jgi:hypothetical protein
MSEIQNLTLEAGVLQDNDLTPQLDEYGCDTGRQIVTTTPPFPSFFLCFGFVRLVVSTGKLPAFF